MSEDENKIGADLAQQELPPNDELPEWFCLIQTNKEYYADRYRDLQQGKNKINYATFFSLISLFSPQLLYRKFFIKPTIISWFFRCLFFFLNSIIITPFLIFMSNLWFSDYIAFSWEAFSIIFPVFYISRKYNAWYLKSVKEKYEAGYRPSFYKDTSSIIKYASIILGIGLVITSLLFFNDSLEFFKLKVSDNNYINFFLLFLFGAVYIFFVMLFIQLFVFINDRIKLRRHLKGLKQAVD